jgi:hypothetical protein
MAILHTLGPDSFISRYCRYAMNRTGSNPAYHIAAALSLLSAATPHSLSCREGLLGSNVPSNFWVMLVGHSGQDFKTASTNCAMELAMTAMPGKMGAEPYSEEGLLKFLAQQPQQYNVWEDWGTLLRRWGGGANNYGSKLKVRLVGTYDCNSLTMPSAKEVYTIEQPKITILTSCNPPFIRDFSEPEDFSGGLYSRFFFVWGHATRDVQRPVIDRDLERELVGILRGWANDENHRICRGFLPGAEEPWLAWREALGKRMQQHTSEEARSMTGRLVLQAAKIMLLLCVAQGRITPDTKGDWFIPHDVVEPALRIADLGVESSLRAVGMANGSPGARIKRVVMDSMVPGEWVNIGRITDVHGLLLHEVEPAILTLVTERKIEQRVGPDSGVLELRAWQPPVKSEKDQATILDSLALL